MVRANYKGSTLLESLDAALEAFDGNKPAIKAPYDRYYRIGTSEEVAELEGLDIDEFERFESEDPVREQIDVVGYAIAKDEYQDMIMNASGLIYAEIGSDGKLYYNVGDKVFEIEEDDLGIKFDDMGEVVEEETPSEVTEEISNQNAPTDLETQLEDEQSDEERDDLKESDYSNDAIINNIYDILSNHNDEMIFEEGCNIDLTTDNKIYIEDNLDGSMYCLTIEKMSDNRDMDERLEEGNFTYKASVKDKSGKGVASIKGSVKAADEKDASDKVHEILTIDKGYKGSDIENVTIKEA